jgi:2-oxoisovalerate dehydrogenase E1 component
VRAAAEAAVAELRAGRGPAFLEARTYRWRGHYEGDPERYRTPEEVARAREGDPLQRFPADPRLEEEVAAEVEAAVVAARGQAHPEADEVTRYTLRDWSEAACESFDEGQEIKYMDAVREALTAELETDPEVWIAGVDVGRGGGVFGITRGLAERFPGRVLDTPISETAVMGLAVGGAMAGSRPVVELMYVDFLGVCFDQVLNQAAKLHFMTGGGASLSLVIRTQCGAGRSSGPQHSQSLESLLAQVPGLKVAMPATAEDAYGMLRAAVHDPNPVVFIEHRLLYGRRGRRPRPEHLVPLGSAAVRRRGSHVTAVSWSRMVHEVLEAAEVLAADGVEVEVIDLRTVAPIDRATIAESVRKTHRLLVAHEAVITSGIGAELAAWAAEELFYDLDAPVRRVAPPFSPVPYAPTLEQAWLPDAARILAALKELTLS